MNKESNIPVQRESVTISFDDLYRALGPIGKRISEDAVIRIVEEQVARIKAKAIDDINELFSRVGIRFHREANPSAREGSFTLTFQTPVVDSGTH